MKERRVVISGMGVISPLGSRREQIRQNILAGKTTFQRSPVVPEVVVSPVENFDLREITGPFKERRYLNRASQFALAAAVLAFRDSGLAQEDLVDAGLFVGVGPNLSLTDLEGDISTETHTLWILKFLPNTAASVMAKYLGSHGENLTIGTACTASLQAIGEAYRKIKNGYLDLALAGGGDSRLYVEGIRAYLRAGALYCGDGVPTEAIRPFDRTRGGFVPGEGGAFFLLEEREHALRRKAVIYGEILGLGISMDGCSMTAPDPTGFWEGKAIRSALKEATISPGDIEVVAAHGTGTRLNDEMEARLLKELFGDNRPMIIAWKSWIGHLSVACGAVELALSLYALMDGYLPEIRNLNQPIVTDLDFLREQKTVAAKTLLIENFGFGGQNCALIVKLGGN